MTRKALLIATIAAGLSITAPAYARSGSGSWWGSTTSSTSGGTTTHTHDCSCGHIPCTTTSGGTTTTTTGGSTGGEIPEPGMLGMLGLGLIGLGYARRRARK